MEMDDKEKAKILDLCMKEANMGHKVEIETRYPETKEGGLTVIVSHIACYKEYHYRVTVDPQMKSPSAYLEECMGRYDNEMEEAEFQEIHRMKFL